MRSLVLAAVCVASMSAQTHLVEGKADSRVRAVIFEDLQCSDCAAFRLMLDEKLLPKYGGRVAFEHRDFPLPKHAWARPASIAALYLQGVDEAKAVAFRQATMRTQGEIRPETFAGWLKKFCVSHGLDGEKAVAALDDAGLATQIQKDYEDGVARGISHTPTVLVNGAPFIETFSLEEISAGLDAALKEHGIQ